MVASSGAKPGMNPFPLARSHMWRLVQFAPGTRRLEDISKNKLKQRCRKDTERGIKSSASLCLLRGCR